MSYRRTIFKTSSAPKLAAFLNRMKRGNEQSNSQLYSMTGSELIAASRKEERLSGFLLEYKQQVVAGIAVEDLRKEDRVASFEIVEVDSLHQAAFWKHLGRPLMRVYWPRLIHQARDQTDRVARSGSCSAVAIRFQDCARKLFRDGQLPASRPQTSRCQRVLQQLRFYRQPADPRRMQRQFIRPRRCQSGALCMVHQRGPTRGARRQRAASDCPRRLSGLVDLLLHSFRIPFWNPLPGWEQEERTRKRAHSADRGEQSRETQGAPAVAGWMCRRRDVRLRGPGRSVAWIKRRSERHRRNWRCGIPLQTPTLQGGW